MCFASPFFVCKFIAYLEGDPDRLDQRIGMGTGSPIEIVVGTALLYSMLGVSCFIGLLWQAGQWKDSIVVGETGILTGQVFCPHSPPDALACFANQKITNEEWIMPGVCAYVPRVRSREIVGNDLESLLTTTLICAYALISGAKMLEDEENGERGIHRTDTSERRWKLAGQNDAGKWMSGRDSGQTQVANGGNNTWMKIKLSSANAFFSLSPSYSYAFGAPQDPQTAYRALIAFAKKDKTNVRSRGSVVPLPLCFQLRLLRLYELQSGHLPPSSTSRST
ncbi:hypothetical protein AZE42_07810 [Rhizopogon vesiculosus]|uniref:Uncharacterized protein n=1 Tax=Rhizopogon vesiculosus TaxID=180088 RepID=A0A1J8QFV7_9AGAM|nr:hypothetical protein AZE42_07810 [Rhizopogon vesiculosus]